MNERIKRGEDQLPLDHAIKAVFFDLGYTLINFDGDFNREVKESYRVLANSLRKARLPISAHDFAQRFSDVMGEYNRSRDIDLIERPVEQFLRQVLIEQNVIQQPPEIIQNALEEMYRFTEKFWQLEPDALGTLKQLRAAGYRLGLITNAASADNANRLIDQSKLRPYFEIILISAVEKIRKSDVRIFQRALGEMNLNAGEAIMVGDTLTADIQGAKNAGLRAVWLSRHARQPETIFTRFTTQPDAEIKSLSELPFLLNRFS